MMDQELKLMLLRHWTLYDSLCNSNYLVSRLTLWKEQGQKDLKRILAHLGVSLDQAKQKYSFMDPNIKNEFKTKFMEVADQFSLGNIAINTFIRQIDNKM
jgi:cell division control protein 45